MNENEALKRIIQNSYLNSFNIYMNKNASFQKKRTNAFPKKPISEKKKSIKKAHMDKVSHDSYLYGANNYMTKEAFFGGEGLIQGGVNLASKAFKWIGRNVSSRQAVKQEAERLGKGNVQTAWNMAKGKGGQYTPRQQDMAKKYIRDIRGRNTNQTVSGNPVNKQQQGPTQTQQGPKLNYNTNKYDSSGNLRVKKSKVNAQGQPRAAPTKPSAGAESSWNWDTSKPWTENVESGAKYFFGNNPKTTAAVGIGLAGAGAYVAHKATQGAASHELKRTAIKWGAGALGGGAAVGIGAGMWGSSRNNR